MKFPLRWAIAPGVSRIFIFYSVGGVYFADDIVQESNGRGGEGQGGWVTKLTGYSSCHGHDQKAFYLKAWHPVLSKTEVKGWLSAVWSKWEHCHRAVVGWLLFPPKLLLLNNMPVRKAQLHATEAGRTALNMDETWIFSYKLKIPQEQVTQESFTMYKQQPWLLGQQGDLLWGIIHRLNLFRKTRWLCHPAICMV